MNLGTNPSGATWSGALSAMAASFRRLPGHAQYEAGRIAGGNWQWAKATWSRMQPDDWWTGRYRYSLRVAFGSPDTSAALPHPDTVSWPEHPPGGGYRPEPIETLMGRVASGNGSAPMIISITLDYADRVEVHAHPRQIAFAATLVTFTNYDWSKYSLLDGGSSIQSGQ